MIFDDDKEQLNAQTFVPDDSSYVRDSLEAKVIDSLASSFPLEYGNIRLEVGNIKVPNKKTYTLAEQKDALLKGNYLSNSVKGDLYLYDKNTNQLLDSLKGKTLLHLPYYTQRGTFIHNGNEYNTLKQMRLRPGIYSRKKSNGELESQFNIQRGTGNGYRISLDPSTGIYKFNIGQSSTSLYSLLHDLGTSDEELEKTWGNDLLNKNKQKYDSRALPKLYSKLVPSKKQKEIENPTREQMIQAIKSAFDEQQVDADIKFRNLA